MKRIEVVRGQYYDSVTLMLVAKELKNIESVADATLNMATQANLHIMKSANFPVDDVVASPDDLIIGIDCPDDQWSSLVERAKSFLSSPPWKSKEVSTEYTPKSLEGAMSLLPDANLVLISLPGRYAAAQAMKALERGLNVMLYSDNVSLEEEIKLKTLAKEKGLLVMGPDCGTAVISGKGLGFSNVCPTGPVGIVSASGTGLQEVMVQLNRLGVGLKHGLGTGGRDVKSSVGGVSYLTAIDALKDDKDISVIVAIGKPPSPEVRKKIINALKNSGKPAVVCFMGEPRCCDEEGMLYTTGLEECAVVTASLVRGENAQFARERLWNDYRQVEALGRSKGATISGRFLRGLYTGGTLCYEAAQVAGEFLGNVYGNAPLREELKLPDSMVPIDHCLIDYGEDEFTQGRLHPMIDPSFRASQLKIQAEDPSVAVVLLDIVLGYGSATNPSEEIVNAINSIDRKDGPLFVAYICGTDRDPQGYERQVALLEKAGVCLFESNRRAAIFAAAATAQKEKR